MRLAARFAVGADWQSAIVFKPAFLDKPIKPGQRETHLMRHVFDKPGNYALQVKLTSDSDVLDADDARSLVVTVKDTIPVLLVNGKPAADRAALATRRGPPSPMGPGPKGE